MVKKDRCSIKGCMRKEIRCVEMCVGYEISKEDDKGIVKYKPFEKARTSYRVLCNKHLRE